METVVCTASSALGIPSRGEGSRDGGILLWATERLALDHIWPQARVWVPLLYSIQVLCSIQYTPLSVRN